MKVLRIQLGYSQKIELKNKHAPVVFGTISTGGFVVHVTPAPYTAHLEWPLVTAVRGADRVTAGGIARFGHRSLSRSRASRRLPTGTEIAPRAPGPSSSVPKTVVAYHAKRRSPWAE